MSDGFDGAVELPPETPVAGPAISRAPQMAVPLDIGEAMMQAQFAPEGRAVVPLTNIWADGDAVVIDSADGSQKRISAKDALERARGLNDMTATGAKGDVGRRQEVVMALYKAAADAFQAAADGILLVGPEAKAMALKLARAAREERVIAAQYLKEWRAKSHWKEKP